MGIAFGSIVDQGGEAACIAFAALVHYFFLVYFCLTVGQSILLYVDLVKVLGTDVALQQYHIKVGLVSWGMSHDV